MLYFEEYEIRQALSFSFVFLFLDEFISNDTNGKKIIWCGVWVLLTFSLHSANIFFIICFLGIYYTCKSIISWKIAVPILFFASYFFADYYDISGVLRGRQQAAAVSLLLLLMPPTHF
jgi:hypothetical protein